MITNQEWAVRRGAATPRAIASACDFFVSDADNAEVWDVEGRRFIDFAAGIATNNTGHCHPKLVAAVRAQLDRFTHMAYQVAPYQAYVELAEKLNEITPGDFRKKTAFFNTGAEAVENAVKFARFHTGRSGVVAFSGAFHGRTLLALALTGKVNPYKAGFGPLPSDVYHVPFPTALGSATTAACLHALESLFKADVDPGDVAAIIFEPVQGEGGFHVAPPELVTALRRISDEHGIVLIADEIQTGFARTGRMFGMEHYGVTADLVTTAKSLAGGLPLSAVTGRAEIMDAPGPGGMGSTFGGNPLALASALAVVQVIEEEKLTARASTLGQRLIARVEGLRREVPQIADIRGLGSMIAVEFATPDCTPLPGFASAVQRGAREMGLIILTCGVYGNVVRFLYPLTITDLVFEEGLHILEQALLDQARANSTANSCSPHENRFMNEPLRGPKNRDTRAVR